MTFAKDCLIPEGFPLEKVALPFDDLIGLEYVAISADSCEARITFEQKHWQPLGNVHGGVYCAIVESVASVSAFAWLMTQGKAYAVGVNNNTNFLRSISTGTAHAISQPIHRGKHQQLWVVEITDNTDNNDRLLAHGELRVQNIFLPD